MIYALFDPVANKGLLSIASNIHATSRDCSWIFSSCDIIEINFKDESVKYIYSTTPWVACVAWDE